MTILLALLWFGLPFILCLHLLSVWKRPVHEAFIAAVVLGLIFPFLFIEPIRRLASYGENIAAEYEMRKWLKRRGKRPQPASKKD